MPERNQIEELAPDTVLITMTPGDDGAIDDDDVYEDAEEVSDDDFDDDDLDDDEEIVAVTEEEYEAERKRVAPAAFLALHSNALGALFIVIILLLAGLYLHISYPTDRGMKIDGEFDDWDDHPAFADDRGDTGNPAIDIASTAAVMEGSTVFFFVEIRGQALHGTAAGGDTIQFFLDSDADASTGYPIAGMGADHLLEVFGEGGKAVTSYFYSFNKEHEGVSRPGLDWNAWERFEWCPVAKDEKRIEARMPYYNGHRATVMVRAMDATGLEDLGPIIPLVPKKERGPVLVDAGPMIDEGAVLEEGANGVMRITISPLDGPVVLEQLTFRNTGTASNTGLRLEVHHEGKRVADGPFMNNKVALEMDRLPIEDETNIFVTVIVQDTAEKGAVLTLELTDVDASTAAVTTSIKKGSWYLIERPDGYVIDGLFREWSNLTHDAINDADRNIDITSYKAAYASEQAFFHINVRGEMMAGANVPRNKAIKQVPGLVGIQAEHPLPVRTGEDLLFIFLKTPTMLDGYKPAPWFPFPADKLIMVKGRDGRVTSTAFMGFTGLFPGEWKWSNIDVNVDARAGAKGLEASLDLNLTEFEVYFHLVGWKNRTGDLSGEKIRVSVSEGIDDPFTLTINGTAHQSDTGENWTSIQPPGSGAEYVDIATGEDGTAGYAYALRSDGAVYLTRNAVDGWYRYGYGSPALPVDNDYVALATGSGTTVGYVCVLRSDGAVFFTRSGVDGWYRYGYNTPTVPDSDAYCDIAAGSGNTAGYVYILRNDGAVYFTSNGVGGWGMYGYGSPGLPTGTSYVSLDAGQGNTAGYVYVLRNDGHVYVARNGVEGWYQYGYNAPALPASTAYTSLDTDGSGRVFVLRNDGDVYFTANGVDGWYMYAYGQPEVLPGTCYVSITSGEGNNAGYVYTLRVDGTVYTAQNGVGGWYRYGYGQPDLPPGAGFRDIAADADGIYALMSNGTVLASEDDGASWGFLADAGGDHSWSSITATGAGHVFALRNDGASIRITTGTGAKVPWPDCGQDTSWCSIASDGTWVYALRNDGIMVYSSTTVGSWSSKGDVGTGSAWTSLATISGSTYVYAMMNDRSVSRSLAGSSTTWSSWAPAGDDTSWVSIAITTNYLFALRRDGTVDRATLDASPAWTLAHGVVGSGGMVGLDTVIGEFLVLLLPVIIVLVVPAATRRVKGLRDRGCWRPKEDSRRPQRGPRNTISGSHRRR